PARRLDPRPAVALPRRPGPRLLRRARLRGAGRRAAAGRAGPRPPRPPEAGDRDPRPVADGDPAGGGGAPGTAVSGAPRAAGLLARPKVDPAAGLFARRSVPEGIRMTTVGL